MTTTKIRLLSPLYLVSLCLMLPLLWLSSKAARGTAARMASRSNKRKWQLMRVLARSGAESLGMMLPLAMLVPAVGAGLLYGPAAGALGALLGFVALSLVPVLMPLPSRDLQ